MPDQYLDVFLTKEDYMMRDMIRSFVEKEIMPVRQQVDDDKEHVIVHRILQGLVDLGNQRAPFPPESAEWAPIQPSPRACFTKSCAAGTAVSAPPKV